MRLYHRKGAGRPLRVAWALEEADAPYEVIWVDSPEGEEHRRRQPLGRVPVLEDDEGFLFESAALCLQVADLYPQAGLIPAVGTHERGLVYQWSVFAMTHLEPSIGDANRLRESDPEAAAAARERFLSAAQGVATALGGHAYLVGDAFSVADIVVSSVLLISRRINLELPSPLGEYIGRMEARPARARVYAELT